MYLALVCLHVFCNLVWIGSVTGVGFLLHQGAAEWARKLYSSVAQWAFGGSFAAGVAIVALDTPSYMKAHWFHGKLTFALGAIALHHVLGAKAKRAAKSDQSGSRQTGGQGAMLTGAFLLCAALAVVFVIFKQSLVH